MDLRHLHTFVTAADLGSFTAAAKSLQLSQAAVSQQIGILEGELSGVLFSRHGRGVSLTSRGEQLLGYARQILALAAEAMQPEQVKSSSLSGELTIAASTVPAEWLMPELLAEFHKICPGIRESLIVTDSCTAIDMVQTGQAEIGFVGAAPDSTALHAQPIAEDELKLFSAAGHPQAQRKSLTLQQLFRVPLILRESGSGSRKCLEQALVNKGHRVSDFKVAMEVNNNESIRAAVDRRVGMAFLSDRTTNESIDRIVVPVRGFHPKRQFFVIHQAPDLLGPLAHRFLQFADHWRKLHRLDRKANDDR